MHGQERKCTVREESTRSGEKVNGQGRKCTVREESARSGKKVHGKGSKNIITASTININY